MLWLLKLLLLCSVPQLLLKLLGLKLWLLKLLTLLMLNLPLHSLKLLLEFLLSPLLVKLQLKHVTGIAQAGSFGFS